MLKVGVDVGGTFTDVYGVDDSTKKVYIGKSLTTPDDITRGLINAIEAAGIKWEDIDVLVHGTTIATNSILTRSYYGWWPKVAFITTEGFKDTIEIRRGRNQFTIDMYGEAPKPLIPRRHRFEVPEKINRNGKIIKELDIEALKGVVQKISDLKVDAVGVTFINSYNNPANEIKAKEFLQKELPGIPICVSTDISPKFRELPRMITTAVRALLLPIISDYMNKLEIKLKEIGFQGTLLIVKGDGGTSTVETIKQSPEELLESGPAAGVYAGLVCTESLGLKDSLTQDMGGTSYDVCIIENNEYLRTTEYEIDFDMPLTLPMIDVRSIGTGGGSIIWIDEGGSLRVGPKSAGAKPGPVCYKLGGKEPTTTDANLILGRIDKTLGGKTELDLEGAIRQLKAKIADPLGISVTEAAEGAIKISCANMARANSVVTTSRGRDPRKFVPIVFGGAGAMHICFVADELGVKKAIVPAVCGVASAMGAVMMPLRVTSERTMHMGLDSPDIGKINEVFADLENKIINGLKAQGVKGKDITTMGELDMRYVGQNYEVTVSVPGDLKFDEKKLEKIQEEFHEVHKKEYYTYNKDFAIAIVNVRVIGIGIHAPMDLPTYPEATYRVEKAMKESRKVYFDGEFVDTPIYSFDKLMYKHVLNGPALIEMNESCVVVVPGWTASLDKYRNILMEKSN